jgi:hypothetical protein
MTALTRYNAARTALAEAHAVDEVKDIRDKAEAMAAYARQAHDTEMIAWVTEIKVRAERRAGELLAELPKSAGTKGQLHGKSSGGHIVVPPEESAKTLADLGISKNESSRWQKLAAVPEDKFEQAVSAAKEIAGEVTTAAMLRASKESQPPKVVVQAPDQEPEDDLLAAYELEVAENRALQERIDTMTKSDTVAELDKWVQKFHQLEGRLGQSITTGNEAAKQAQRQGKLLKQIREALMVERDSEILPKLKGGV